MKEYIPKATVVAEIERLIAALDKCPKLNDTQIAVLAGDKVLLLKLLSFLDTLETKEVDLEKELDYNDYISFFKEHPNYSNGDWGFEETWAFGQYCYKLGLAQK